MSSIILPLHSVRLSSAINPARLFLLSALLFCSFTEMPGQTNRSTYAVPLQKLLDRQHQAIASGEPSRAAASSEALAHATLVAIEAVRAETSKLPHSSPKFLSGKAQEKQLRNLLANTYDDWGTAEARQQRYQSALAHFQQAEHWDASSPGLMKHLGTAAFREENYSESARALASAVSTDPADANTRLMLAMSLFSIEQFQQSEKNFSPISSVVLNDPRATYAWAYSLIRTDQPKQGEALAAMLEARDLSPDVRLLVCKLYTASTNYTEALRCLHRLEDVAPASGEVAYQIGATLIHMDLPGEAIQPLRSALKSEPRDPDAAYDLAFALLQTSRRDEGIEVLDRLVAANPNYPLAHYQLGKALLEAGETQKAIPNLEAAARLGPDEDFIHYQLQLAYRRIGRTADANRELELYKQLKDRARDRAAERLEQSNRR